MVRNRTAGLCLRYIALFCCFCLLYSCRESARPPVSSFESDYTFPTARQDSKIEHVFRIPNTGSASLRLARISSSCGCTTANIAPGMVVEPNTTLEVPVVVDLKGKQGEVSSKVAVYFDDKPIPIVLTVKGRIAFEHTKQIDFGNVKRGMRTTKSLSISAFPGLKRLEILTIDASRELFDVNVASGTNASLEQQLEISLHQDIPFGSFDEMLAVTTNDPDVPEKLVRLTGYVLRPVELSVNELDFGVLRPGDAVSESVKMSLPYGDVIEVAALKNSRPELFSCELGWNSGLPEINVRVLSDGVENCNPGIVKAEVWVESKVNGQEYRSRFDVYGLRTK